MARYIDADKIPYTLQHGGSEIVYKNDVDKIPTADVAEVVRCENCRYFYKGKMVNRCTLTTLGLKMPHRDAWCCYGEKKDETTL